ncbi:hypothetical protein ACFL02_07695 [Planctomycetota bacterium]
MKFDNEPLDKEILDRLSNHQIWISRNAPPMNKEKALVLIGEAMLDKFIKEFVHLWKDELFPHCLLRDHDASPEEVREMLGLYEDYNKSEKSQEGDKPSKASCSGLNNCKGVVKMNQSIQAKSENYLELFEEMKKKTGDERIAMSLLQEVSKDRRMEEIREEREMKNGEPATTRQLQFMKKLGIEVPPGATKKQASMLIDEELGKDNA